MKAYSIGRDHGCDIVVNDNTDVISRRHAVINVSATGKITIIDQSSNGTYVNGIRISPNVPVPVTRKDVISFAHVSQLDWGAVPASNIWMRYSIIAVLAILLITGGIFGYQHFTKDNNNNPNPVELTDTIKEKDRIEEKTDTIQTSTDVINENDTIKKKNVPEKVTPKREKKDDKKKKEEDNKEQETEKASGNRPIG